MSDKPLKQEPGIDVQLVRKSIQGDREAYGRLVDGHSKRTYAIAYSIISDFQAAQDIAQEAFVRAYSRLEKLKAPEKFGAWMDVITRNIARRALQKKRSAKVSFTDFSDDSMHPVINKSSGSFDIQEALNSLPVTYREALVMRYMGGASYEEIAVHTGTRRNTAEVRVHRAKKMLRDSLTGETSPSKDASAGPGRD